MAAIAAANIIFWRLLQATECLAQAVDDADGRRRPRSGFWSLLPSSLESDRVKQKQNQSGSPIC